MKQFNQMVIDKIVTITKSKKKLKLQFFYIYKIYLISAEGHKNADVHFLKIRKTDEIWPSIKDVGNSLGVKNVSDLVLKEIYGIYGKKN